VLIAYPTGDDLADLTVDGYAAIAHRAATQATCPHCSGSVHVRRTSPGNWQSLTYHAADCPTVNL